ncbi:hypothetical protein AS149_25130 [Burkholderia cenocepacia]|nr:hypothetical protein AS149_25130 [Burkholderia cenocepacia]
MEFSPLELACCLDLLELQRTGESPQAALRALADTYNQEIPAPSRRVLAESNIHRQALEYVVSHAPPETLARAHALRSSVQ